MELEAFSCGSYWAGKVLEMVWIRLELFFLLKIGTAMLSNVEAGRGLSDSKRATLIGTYLKMLLTAVARAIGSDGVVSFISLIAFTSVVWDFKIGRTGEAS